MMLATDKTIDRTDIHEVKPRPDCETRHVHFFEMPRAVFCHPIIIVVGVAIPFSNKVAVVGWHTANGVHLPEADGAGGSANPVAFLEKTQASICHVLRHQMRGARYREKVLRESCL